MFVLTDIQRVTLHFEVIDAAGNPAAIDGTPEWGSSDEAILTVAPADDGMSAMVTTVGPLGAAQIHVTADADLGEGVRPLTGILDFEVHGSEAVALNLLAGEPEPR